MKALGRLTKWFLIDLAILIVAFALARWHFASMVEEEYRMGWRTATDGDAIMIPVMGIVFLTAMVLLCANVCQFAYFHYRRRRMLPDRTRKGPLSPEEAKEESPQNNRHLTKRKPVRQKMNSR